MPNRIGLSSITFAKLPVREALEHTADLGFPTVDIGVVGQFCPHFDPADPASGKEIVETVDRVGLSVSTLNSVPSIFGIKDTDQLIDVVKTIVALASELGAYGVTIDAGFPRTDPWEIGAKSWAEFIPRAWEAGQDKGVEVSIEAPHAGSHGNSIEEAEKLVGMIPAQIGITYDTSHVIGGGSDAAESLKILGDRIKHVHLRDATPADSHRTPGDGDYDFSELFRYMKEKGYSGDYNFELEYGERELSIDEIGREAARAREFITKTMESV